MVLADFVQAKDLRAVLGVSEDELEDEVLSRDLYAFVLERELRDVAPTLPEQLIAIQVLPTSTEAQQNFIVVARLFCVYAVANHLAIALPLFAPKDISDGKVSISRFADAPYKLVIDAVRRQYRLARSRLQGFVGNASVVTPSVMVAASPSRDPVAE